MFTKGHKINVGRKRPEWVKEKIRKAHLGKKMSLEAKQRMGLAKKGKKPKNWEVVQDYFLHKKKTGGEFKKGVSWVERVGEIRAKEMLISVSERFKGKKQSIKQRQLKRLSQLGEKGSNWQGGKTLKNHRSHHPTDLYLKLWIEAVFKRDNYICVDCGDKSRKGHNVTLQADHIKEWADYPKLRYEVRNGQTLCLKCHKKKTITYLKKKAQSGTRNCRSISGT